MNRKFIRYFNIMADIIRAVLNNGTFDERDYQSVLCDEECEPYDIITDCVPALFVRGDGNISPASLKLMEMDDYFFTNLEELVGGANKYVLMLLLYYMDRAIVECYNGLICFEDEVTIAESLNSNREENDIYLLKKTKCKWASRQIGDGLSGILHNFYYIDNKKISGIVARNYILDSNLLRGIEQNSLRVAVSPVTKEKIVEFSEPYERKNEETGASQRYFRVENIINESLLLEIILNNIYIAGQNNVDILVFPEMLGTQSMLEQIIERLKSDSAPFPTLIVFPSIWQKTENDGNNNNQSCVLLNGELLFSQHKYCNFKYKVGEKPVYEDINRNKDESKIIHMIHIEGIGRICIIICYDYLDKGNRDKIMDNLVPTLVCSPSFSTGSFNFAVLSEKYLSEGCNWVWCNTCSAAHETEKEENFKIVGVITMLHKNWNMGEEDLKKFLPGKFECDRTECKECLCYADISLTVAK